MKILVTGAAGFIGSATAHALLDRGDQVIGIDNLNPYYDVTLKEARLARLTNRSSFAFHRIDIGDAKAMHDLIKVESPQRFVHLAAQAGVRYSLENPQSYVDANITGFLNVLECARHHSCEHLVFASSSSVYGNNRNMPFTEHNGVDHPTNLYAATKKSNELMAHTYAHLFGVPCTGLRFFTVYGPWGRPDMALFLFTRKLLAGEAIDVFNHGRHTRDFTYVDDIVEGVIRILDKPATADPAWSGEHPHRATSSAPWRIYNIGSNHPVQLAEYIRLLEKVLGVSAKMNLLPMQPGDVPDTFASVEGLVDAVGYRPSTPTETGIRRFVEWYLDFYRVTKPGVTR